MDPVRMSNEDVEIELEMVKVRTAMLHKMAHEMQWVFQGLMITGLMKKFIESRPEVIRAWMELMQVKFPESGNDGNT